MVPLVNNPPAEMPAFAAVLSRLTPAAPAGGSTRQAGSRGRGRYCEASVSVQLHVVPKTSDAENQVRRDQAPAERLRSNQGMPVAIGVNGSPKPRQSGKYERVR